MFVAASVQIRLGEFFFDPSPTSRIAGIAFRQSQYGMKMIVEPTGCLGAAAALHGIVPVEGKKVGIPREYRLDGIDPDVAKSASPAQAVSFPLRELNQRSGNFGSWAVVVHQARVIGERW